MSDGDGQDSHSLQMTPFQRRLTVPTWSIDLSIHRQHLLRDVNRFVFLQLGLELPNMAASQHSPLDSYPDQYYTVDWKALEDDGALTLIGLTQYRLVWTKSNVFSYVQSNFHIRYPMTIAGAVDMPPAEHDQRPFPYLLC